MHTLQKEPIGEAITPPSVSECIRRLTPRNARYVSTVPRRLVVLDSSEKPA